MRFSEFKSWLIESGIRPGCENITLRQLDKLMSIAGAKFGNEIPGFLIDCFAPTGILVEPGIEDSAEYYFEPDSWEMLEEDWNATGSYFPDFEPCLAASFMEFLLVWAEGITMYYPFNTIGGMVNLLDHYGMGSSAHSVMFGEGFKRLEYRGKLLAVVEFDPETDFPTFHFTPEYDYLAEAQKNRKGEALRYYWAYPLNKISDKIPVGAFYLGTVKGRNDFGCAFKEYDIWFDLQNYIVCAVNSAGEVLKQNFFRLTGQRSDDPNTTAENEALRRVNIFLKVQDKESLLRTANTPNTSNTPNTVNTANQ